MPPRAGSPTATWRASTTPAGASSPPSRCPTACGPASSARRRATGSRTSAAARTSTRPCRSAMPTWAAARSSTTTAWRSSGLACRPMTWTSREIRLASRPAGEPQPSDFQLAEVEVGDPDDGEVVVRNTFMSVDPYMRGRMNDVPSYLPPFALRAPLEGAPVGEVVASRNKRLAEGDIVTHQLGWREYARVSQGARKVDASGVPESAFLGVLGMPGLTAYVGLLDIAELREGDVVFVSGAAGAVGSLAGQIAKLRGHTVIGSAGSAEKVAWLRDELGFDAAFAYHDGVYDGLKAAAPDGIDLYFDNVGGEHLEAAISRLHNR